MREHLHLRRRLSLQQRPLLVGGSNFDMGMAFWGLLSSSYQSTLLFILLARSSVLTRARDASLLAVLRAAVVHGSALVAAVASRASLLLLTIGVLVETGMGVIVILVHVAWGLLFGVGIPVAFV